jgi:[ribosomal protein S5]-alanine N-acetyltransferase
VNRPFELVKPQLFAALTFEVDWSQLHSAVGPAFERFYGTAGLPPTGKNVATYRPVDGRARVQVGTLVDEVFEGVGDVACTCTPAGFAISTLHVGPYSGLVQTHHDLGAHRDDLNLINWEIYGDWNDDPSKLETRVFQLGFPRIPLLETARLELQPLRLDHADALQPQFADYEVIKHMTRAVPWPYPDDGVRDFLSDYLQPRMDDGRVMAWAIVLKGQGAIGLLEWRNDPSTVDDRGFWLGRAHWGRGYMTEAIAAFQDWLFLERGHDRLRVRNAVENVGSHRIKVKTGGVLVGQSACQHHEGDVAELWEVTARSWSEARSAHPKLNDGDG